MDQILYKKIKKTLVLKKTSVTVPEWVNVDDFGFFLSSFLIIFFILKKFYFVKCQQILN